MQFNYAYQGSSRVQSAAARTSISFSPDTSRDPAWFKGVLREGVAFREAISAAGVTRIVVDDENNSRSAQSSLTPTSPECSTPRPFAVRIPG